MEQIAENKSFGGRQLRFSHTSQALGCDMTFAVYLPPAAERQRVPVLYWLSGLTCTDENFVQKAGAQQYAAQYGVAVVAPDTSPRGDGVPDDPEADYLEMWVPDDDPVKSLLNMVEAAEAYGRDEIAIARFHNKNMRYKILDDATAGFAELLSGGSGWGSDRYLPV